MVVQRIMRMTIQDISKKHGVNGDVMLCSRSLQAIIKLAHPRMTSTDLVRTLAVQPELVKLLEIASPRDVALAFNWEIHATCESMTLKQMIDNLTRSHLPYRANNDTLQKIGKELNMTTKEIASLLRETTVSLLLTPAIKPDVLRQEIQMKKVIEEKVSRMECFVLELTRLQPECNVNLLKLQKVLRNYSYQIVRNMSDIAVKRVISRNQIGVFIKNILIKNLLLFFAQTWESFKGLRLRDIIVELLGVPLDVLTRDYSYLSDAVVVENTLNEVEIYWNISTVELTLEKVLTASRLMEGRQSLYIYLLSFEVTFLNIKFFPHRSLG